MKSQGRIFLLKTGIILIFFGLLNVFDTVRQVLGFAGYYVSFLHHFFTMVIYGIYPIVIGFIGIIWRNRANKAGALLTLIIIKVIANIAGVFLLRFSTVMLLFMMVSIFYIIGITLNMNANKIKEVNLNNKSDVSEKKAIEEANIKKRVEERQKIEQDLRARANNGDEVAKRELELLPYKRDNAKIYSHEICPECKKIRSGNVCITGALDSNGYNYDTVDGRKQGNGGMLLWLRMAGCKNCIDLSNS